MKTKHLISTVIIFLMIFFISCGSSNTSITGSWKNDKIPNKHYSNVFIAALAPNAEAKNTLESELAYQARSRGVKAVKSSDVFIRTFTKENIPQKEEILNLVKQNNCDAIFTVTVQNKETTSRYVPGSSTYYTPMGYGSYYGNFYGYYSNMYTMTYDPGYYTTDKVYYLESNLYDVETEALIWSAQSKTYNPSNSEDFTKGYTEAIIKQLEKDGIIKEMSKK